MKPTGATKEWRVEPRPIHGYQVIDSDGTEILADVYRKEDAELIVTAVNERERLREALEQIRDGLFRYNMGDYETCAKNVARMALNGDDYYTQTTSTSAGGG